jgi:endoglucanase
MVLAIVPIITVCTFNKEYVSMKLRHLVLLACVMASFLFGCHAKAGTPDEGQALRDRVQKLSADWFGEWTPDVERAVAEKAANTTPTKRARLVLFYITNRDLGQFSSGGAKGEDAYRQYVRAFSAGLGKSHADVILEPDSLMHTVAMSATKSIERKRLVKYAVDTLMANNPNSRFYVDAGHPGWLKPEEVAPILKEVGIMTIRGGFAVNVSNFQTTAACIQYAHALSPLVGGKHAVIDVSRNGNGPSIDGEWCNPPGRALGKIPTYTTGDPSIDALLWVKNPAESDGEKNGGIPAGQYHPKYLQELARNAKF